MAYDVLDPFGNQRGDFQAAGIASVIANVHRDPKKHRQPFARGDFIPDYAADHTAPAKPDLAAKLKAGFGRMPPPSRSRK